MKTKKYLLIYLPVLLIIGLGIAGYAVIQSDEFQALKQKRALFLAIFTPQQQEALKNFRLQTFGSHLEIFQKIRQRMADSRNFRQELDLSPEQKDQLGEIFGNAREYLKPAVNDLIAAGELLRKEILAENPSPEGLDKAAGELGLEIGEIAVRAADVIQIARMVLTPDQIATARRFIDAHEQQRLEMRQKLPERIDRVIALRKELNLSNAQVIKLAEFAADCADPAAGGPGMPDWFGHDEFYNEVKIKGLLNAEQIQIWDEFHQNRKDNIYNLRVKIRDGLQDFADLVQDLNLTETQTEKIFALLDGKKAEFLRLSDQLEQSGAALREEVLLDEPDETRIRNAAARVGDDLGEAALALSDVIQSVNQILEPQQVALLRQFEQARNQDKLEIINRHLNQAQDFPELMRDLKLTAEQEAALDELMDEHINRVEKRFRMRERFFIGE